MKIRKLVWRKDTRPYANGELGTMNRVVLFSVHRDDTISFNGQPSLEHILLCTLPGYTSIRERHPTSAAGRARAEVLWKTWAESMVFQPEGEVK